jgi:signal transduction histidine kinase
MLAVFGRGDAIVGKPLLEAVPELKETGLPGYYQQVLATGEPYHHPAERVLLMKNGQPYWGYYNYTYKPLYDEQGTIYGVICTSLDVTAEVAAQQALANSEARLQNAVDLAELATWHADVPSGRVIFSARFHEWMGLGQQTRIEDAFDAVAPSESARIKKAFQRAISEPSSGQLDVEFPVTNSHTGQSRLVRIVGQTQRDEQGQPLSIHGFAQDVTQLRAGQQALESLVEERTNELAVANQELAAANCLLTQSNNNLQTFAYVASHDLQEPLRKIQQFGDLLNQHYADDLGEGKIYVERMQSAASRMSTLIRDLLDYSRIATQRDKSGPVALNRIVDQVLSTLDWTIQEAGAQIQIDSLPTLSGDRSQLGQLFQNLLSNALKFRQADTTPLIQVRAQAVAAVDLPSDVKPSRVVAQYYRLDVRDNGVGFDEKYLDRIFQVFQRLHDKKEFAGTGIGLAICEKVVTNHGGVITASSQPGQGATFSIYLPAE